MYDIKERSEQWGFGGQRRQQTFIVKNCIFRGDTEYTN